MSHLQLVPIALVLLATVTFVVSYIIAVLRGDVHAVFPYISNTGSKRPESCIFGQLLNCVAVLAFLTMYIHYKAVEAMCQLTLNDNQRLCRLNRSSLCTGLISAFGVSIVANFQQGTIVEVVHLIGALTAFSTGIIYCFLQTVLSYHTCPDFNSLLVCRIRLSISVTSCVSLLITIISAVFAIHQWKMVKHTESKFKWSPGDPGYTAHLVSAVGEWVTALTFMFFFFTYVKEFHKFDLKIKILPMTQPLETVHENHSAMDVNERTGLLA